MWGWNPDEVTCIDGGAVPELTSKPNTRASPLLTASTALSDMGVIFSLGLPRGLQFDVTHWDRKKDQSSNFV